MPRKKTGKEIAEVELIYRNKQKESDRPSVTCSQEAYEVLMKTWDENKLELQEQFRVILLDRKGSCLGVSTVATGGVADCLVDLKIVFATALKARASSIILAHNHPSGNTKFSQSDKDLTHRFAEAGKLLDVPVRDHIVVTKEGYASLADKGLMP